MPRVTVTISPNGKVIYEVDGVKGPSCEKLTAALQRAVGKTVLDRKTEDYYADESVEVAERRMVSE